MLVSDLLAQPPPPTRWLLDPYITVGGITFLHGKKGAGKSAITWELARCVSQGIAFFGCPTVASTVLYLENDLTIPIAYERLRHLPQPGPGPWYIEFLKGESCRLDDPRFAQRATEWQHVLEPKLVIWNTLWYFIAGKASGDPQVPHWAYERMMGLFPHAAHVIVHHDRKDARDPKAHAPDEESFSGASGWRDLAQVSLHIVTHGDKRGSGMLRLVHTGAQGSAPAEPLVLQLAPDGTQLSTVRDAREAEVLQAWATAPPGTWRARVSWTANTVRVSESTVKAYLRRAEEHDGDADAAS